MALPKDFREFIESLNSHEVDYAIVGGYAVAFHGYPRFTADIDFLLRGDRANADRVVAALTDFGFGSLGIESGDFTQPDRVIQLGRPPRRIDLLTSITGVDTDRALATRVAAPLDGTPTWFLAEDLLLLNKRATGRVKDRADADTLARRRRR